MVPKIYSGLLALWTNVTGVQTGTTYNVDVPSTGPRDVLSYFVTQSGTSATWHIEGRNDPADSFVQLATGTAGIAGTIPYCKQIRVRLSAATAATVRTSINAVLRA